MSQNSIQLNLDNKNSENLQNSNTKDTSKGNINDMPNLNIQQGTKAANTDAILKEDDVSKQADFSNNEQFWLNDYNSTGSLENIKYSSKEELQIGKLSTI